MQVDIKKLSEQREVLIAEGKVLLKNNTKLQSELDRFLGKGRPVEMPGFRGMIVSVDPKYDFVVLNVGGDQGAKERGEVLVNRNGELIAKLVITSVQANRSIANILPESKRPNKEVMEGDQVFY